MFVIRGHVPTEPSGGTKTITLGNTTARSASSISKSIALARPMSLLMTRAQAREGYGSIISSQEAIRTLTTCMVRYSESREWFWIKRIQKRKRKC